MHRTRILVVEDDPDHQILLHDILTENRPSVEIRMLGTGEEACREIANAAGVYDCVILDYILPDGDADVWLERLTKLGFEAPILVISSSNQQRAAINSLRGGSADFVPKYEALVQGRLWERVEQALAHSKQQEATRRRIKRRTEELVRLAEHDPLTGLLNRHRLGQIMANGRKVYDRRGFTFVVMLDIDHFKHINDSMGHAQGDKVLRAIADVIRSNIGDDGFAYRYGGEEFLLIFQAESFCEGVALAERIRDKVQQCQINGDRGSVSVTASLGVADCTHHMIDEDLIRRADQAMYTAKRQGRNQVCIWDMWQFEQIAAEVMARNIEAIELRLNALIEEYSDRLGPTKRIHLTTHSYYVSRMAVRFGMALAIEPEGLEELRIAGLYHDLGKLLIPESVLAKPGVLTASERLILRRHASDGARMCESLGGGEQVCLFIRQHHTDYEEASKSGISEEDLPLGARILAVADALVTMISHRPYQSGRLLQLCREGIAASFRQTV